MDSADTPTTAPAPAPQPDLPALTRRLFAYLDVVEESDEGREFHPVHLSCCRAMWVEDLNATLAAMRKAVGLPDLPPME